MSLDNKILEFRLLAKDSVISAASISKCASKLQQYRDSSFMDKSLLESFLKEILIYKLEVQKSCKQFEVLQAQHSEYETMESSIQSNIEEAQRRIADLEKNLIECNEVRAHRIECEEVARLVNQQRPTSVLKRKIGAVEESLANNNQLLAATDRDIASKRSTFDSMQAYMIELRKAVALPVLKEDAESDDEADFRENARDSRGVESSSSSSSNHNINSDRDDVENTGDGGSDDKDSNDAAGDNEEGLGTPTVESGNAGALSSQQHPSNNSLKLEDGEEV